MDYRVVMSKGKATKETVVITGCTCASEAEIKALKKHPGFSIYDISRCGSDCSAWEKLSVED